MRFSEHFDPQSIQSSRDHLFNTTPEQVQQLLNKTNLTFQDFLTLISPAAESFLEPIAQRSQALTQQRFGKTMTLFMPMYLSNECYNNCSYCGFSYNLEYERKTLTDTEILHEAKKLKEKGMDHVLLLTGEAPKTVGVSYIANAVRLIRPFFSSIGIEVQPLTTDEYQHLMQAGVDNLAVYQETYHPDAYKTYHLSGKKRRFTHRLDTMDRAGKAGFYKLNIGALLGLHEWQYEAIALYHHFTHLQQHYWQSKLALSIPRIKEMIGDFDVKYPVSDAQLLQFICAFRLCFPDLSISLSTRESEGLRNNLLGLGITDMSAESSTNPGGYSGSCSEEQFSISDTRSVTEIAQHLLDNGYEPVLKNWDSAVIGTPN